MAAGVMELTDADFEQTIRSAQVPVFVDFWAERCPPCRRIAPIVEELAGEFTGRLAVAKVDVDANHGAAIRLGIQSIPTLMIFKGGELKERFVGAHPKQTFVDAINRVL